MNDIVMKNIIQNEELSQWTVIEDFSSEKKYPKDIMEMMENNKINIDRVEKELIQQAEENKEVIDLIELFISDKRKFVQQICGTDIQRFILDHECMSAIKTAKDIYVLMNDYDKKVENLTREINQKREEKTRKIKDKTNLEEKRNSFLKGKDINKLDAEINTLAWDIDTLSTELKEQENHAKNIRIVSQKRDRNEIIHLSTTRDKKVFIQWCKDMFYAIEEHIFKKYEWLYQYISEDFLYQEIVDALSFGPHHLLADLLLDTTTKFNNFIDMKSVWYDKNFRQMYQVYKTVYTDPDISDHIANIYNYMKQEILKNKEIFMNGMPHIKGIDLSYIQHTWIDSGFMRSYLCHTSDFRNFWEMIKDGGLQSMSIIDKDENYMKSRTQTTANHKDIYFMRNTTNFCYGDSKEEQQKKWFDNFEDKIFIVNTIGNFGNTWYGVPINSRVQSSWESPIYGYSIVSKDYEERGGTTIALDDIFIFVSEKNYAKAKEIALKQGKSTERVENNLILIPQKIYENVERTQYGPQNGRIQEGIQSFINEVTKQKIHTEDTSALEIYDIADREKVDPIGSNYQHYFLTRPLGS